MRPFLPALIPCALALFGLQSCQSSDGKRPEQSALATEMARTEARIAQERTATASVVAIDQPGRCVTLRNEEGRLLEVRCGPGVRNFDQIAVGDTLRVRYSATVKAPRQPAGATAQPARGAAVAARAEKGEKPAGGVEVAVRVSVRIESIDVPHDIVVFSLASGDLIAHRIATPEGREFVKGLTVGDAVQLDYDEALALSVEAVAKQ